MASWTFSLDALDAAERHEAWIDVLRRLRLPIADPVAVRPTRGSVTVATGPLGTEFALMEASPQVYSGRNVIGDAAAWLIVMLEGEGELRRPSGQSRIGPGAVVLGAPGIDTMLALESDFRLLFIRFPRLAINPRLIAPLGRRVEPVDMEAGIGPILFGFLSALAGMLRTLSEQHLAPVEQSTIELLVGLLASTGDAEARGGAAGAKASHLRRLCQRIEARLPDPDLSLASVAADDRISPRYVQKLFAAAGIKFSGYVRSRRLDRCYADLISPIHAQLSISEICFRWGFSDAAHFSRAFRDRYGVTPSQHRQSHGAAAHSGADEAGDDLWI